MDDSGAAPAPEYDLLRRFENMIAIQIETIDGIDDKAAFTARFVGIIMGLLVATVSIVLSTEAISLPAVSPVTILSFLLGLVLMFFSLGMAIITYLSSRFDYGPDTDFGYFIAEHPVDNQEYQSDMLIGYAMAIDRNKRVVRSNARRFKWSLATLLGGLTFLIATGALLILPMNDAVHGVVFLISVLVTGAIMRYIVREAYLTLQEESQV